MIPDLAGASQSLRTQLRVALPAVTIIEAPLPVPTEQMPCVRVRLVGIDLLPTQLVAGFNAGAPDRMTVRWEVGCWVTSAEPPQDDGGGLTLEVVRRRDELLGQVLTALRGLEPTLGGRVQVAWPTGIVQFPELPEGEALYAAAVLEVQALTLA